MKPVTFAPGYTVDREGRVWRGDELQPTRLNSRGEPVVYFRRVDPTVRMLARVVGEAYSSPYRRDYRPIYLDGDPRNCRADNLRWRSKGKQKIGSRLPKKLTGSPHTPVPIPGSDGYAVHAEGYISRKGVPCEPYVDPSGTLRLAIRMKNYYYQGFSVGRAVGQAFDPDFIPDLLTAYKDGNPANCALENLKWVPRDYYLNPCKGSARCTARLTEGIVAALRRGEMTAAEVRRRTGASQPTINSAKHGRTWKHVSI